MACPITQRGHNQNWRELLSTVYLSNFADHKINVLPPTALAVSDNEELGAEADWQDWLGGLLSNCKKFGNDVEVITPLKLPKYETHEVVLPTSVAVVQAVMSLDFIMGPKAADPADVPGSVPTRQAALEVQPGATLCSSALSRVECAQLDTAPGLAFDEDSEVLDEDSEVLITRGATFHAEGGACFISSCSKY